MIELFLCFFVIDMPYVNKYVFLSSPLWVIWGNQLFCFLISGFLLLTYGEARKWYSRKHP